MPGPKFPGPMDSDGAWEFFKFAKGISVRIPLAANSVPVLDQESGSATDTICLPGLEIIRSSGVTSPETTSAGKGLIRKPMAKTVNGFISSITFRKAFSAITKAPGAEPSSPTKRVTPAPVFGVTVIFLITSPGTTDFGFESPENSGALTEAKTPTVDSFGVVP